MCLSPSTVSFGRLQQVDRRKDQLALTNPTDHPTDRHGPLGRGAGTKPSEGRWSQPHNATRPPQAQECSPAQASTASHVHGTNVMGIICWVPTRNSCLCGLGYSATLERQLGCGHRQAKPIRHQYRTCHNVSNAEARPI